MRFNFVDVAYLIPCHSGIEIEPLVVFVNDLHYFLCGESYPRQVSTKPYSFAMRSFAFMQDACYLSVPILCHGLYAISLTELVCGVKLLLELD